MGKEMKVKRNPNHRWIGWEAPCRGWTRSCSAGIWVSCSLRHLRSQCRLDLRTERDRPKGMIVVSAAYDGSRETGRPGCCAGVQAGSGRRLGVLLGAGREGSSLYLRSCLIKEHCDRNGKPGLVTNDGSKETEQNARYDLGVVGRRGHRGWGEDETKGREERATRGKEAYWIISGAGRGGARLAAADRIFLSDGMLHDEFCSPGRQPNRCSRGLRPLDTRLESHCISPCVGRDRRPCAGVRIFPVSQLSRL